MIGGGAGGMTSATQIKRKDPSKKVMVLDKGNYVSWAGCPTPYYIAGKLPEKSVIHYTPEYFRENRKIDVFIKHEVKEVLEVYNQSNLVLKYGFNHRFHYSVIEAKKIINSGIMGKFLWIRGVYGKAGSIDYHKNWRNYKKYSGGGILMDQGIHMIDLISYFTNLDFEILSAKLTKSFWNIEVEDNAFVTMQSDNIVATIHSSATQWKHKFLLEMEFENGYINLDGILSSSRSYTPETLITAKREFEDITYAMGKPKEQTIWFENDNSWKFELEEFVGAILYNTPIKQGTIYDALKALGLVENIYKKSSFYE